MRKALRRLIAYRVGNKLYKELKRQGSEQIVVDVRAPRWIFHGTESRCVMRYDRLEKMAAIAGEYLKQVTGDEYRVVHYEHGRYVTVEARKSVPFEQPDGYKMRPFRTSSVD